MAVKLGMTNAELINSINSDLGNVVTLTGNQTISGHKSFTQQLPISIVKDTNQQEVPSQTTAGQIGLYRNKTYTKGDGYSSWVQGYRGSNGYTVSSLYVRRFLESDEKEIVAEVGSAVSPTGVPYAYCTQTPTTNTPGDAIVNVNYVNIKFQVVSALPANPDSRIYYFVTG